MPEVSPALLKRATELDPLVWTLAHRRIGGEGFGVIPPLVDIYRDAVPEVVVAKASQVFISEMCINWAFWVADTRQGERGNVLYIFPAREQLGDFVRARIDTAVAESPYLTVRVKPQRGLGEAKSVDAVGLKRVGRGFVYFRGSNTEAGLLTVDADLVVYDEVDRLKEGTLALGQKRLGSSLLGWQRYASTPKYPETGIDALWLQSDRRRYHIKCGRCGEWQYLKFPDNVLEDGTTICASCKKPIDRLTPGEWVAEMPGREIHGYHMTKLLSPRADIKALTKLGYGILNRDITDASQAQEFYNQDLGLAHAPEGGQLTRAEIESCIEDYLMSDFAPRGTTMGVDVGAKLHVKISASWPTKAGKARAATIKTVPLFEDLDGLMRQYDVRICVIDAQPEGHKAREFASRFPGRVWLCYYPDPARWSHKQPIVWKPEERVVDAHRTLTLDAMFAEVRERKVEFPRDVMAIPGFAQQMMAPVRVLEKDARGEMIAKYVEGGAADHYAHASNYDKIARMRGRGDPFAHVRLPEEVAK